MLSQRIDMAVTEEWGLSRVAVARVVVAQLGSEAGHGVGQTVGLCESRGDCVIVVTCDCCGKMFTLDEDQYELLVRWSESRGAALACGIAPLPG